MAKKALPAKTSQPRLFGVVPRERLFLFLDDNRGRPLTWVHGPPGAGKTALVASYLESRGFPALWYQVDAGDGDPASVFHYWVAAAASLLTVDAVALPRFAPEHHADLPAFARLFFRAYFAELPPGTVCVLDNYQEVPADASFHEIFLQAIAELPTNFSIIAISRAEAPPSFVRLTANAAMAGLGWEELRLTLDEVRGIAAQRKATDDWLVRALHQQSQGWAAGITLMLERLGHFDGNARELPSETRESVFDYFASLIFDQAPESTRHILLSIAFMPRVTPTLAQELSGRAEALTLFEDLYRRRLFTDRRSGPDPVYQLHALFRDFLKNRAVQTYSSEVLNALLCRSASALEKTGDIDGAMELYLSMQNWDEATRLTLREAKDLLTSGRRQTLILWIQAIPEPQQEAQPWLLHWLGRALMHTAPGAGIKSIERSLDCFRQFDDQRAQMECLTVLLDGAFLGFRAFEEMDRWLDELLALMDSSPGFESLDAELRIWGVLATTLFHVRPWHPSTVIAYRRVDELLPNCTDPSVGLAASTGALVVSGLCGDFDIGNRVAGVAEAFASQKSASPSEAAWCMGQVGWLRFMQARYEESLDALERGARIAESNGVRPVLWVITMWRFSFEWRAVAWTAANNTLARVEAMPMPASPMAEAMLRLFQGRRAVHAGNLDEAARLVALGQQSVLRTRSRLEEVVFCLSSADILLHTGRKTEAKTLLAQLRVLIERVPIYRCFYAALVFMEARSEQVSGNRIETINRLCEAMALAKEGNSRHYLRFTDYSMPSLFRLALEEGIEVDLVLDIIRLFRLKPPADAPDNWPWPVRIVTLGRFEAQVNGEPLEFSRKLPRKTLLLLKAIVAYGGRDVPEQMLCDALWGDEEGDAARNALSITVLRLRKLLGSHESVVHQGGKVSLNRGMCWVDAWAFESRLADTGFDRSKVLVLYGGSFLPEDEGESWSVAPRERLRGKFIDALSRSGATLESEGDLPGAVQCYLRGTDADLIVESFHQGLMRCYERLGRRTEALSVYRRLKHTLSVVLGVPPSEATQRLFQEMLRRQTEEGTPLQSDADILAQIATGSPGPAGKSGVLVRLPAKRTRRY